MLLPVDKKKAPVQWPAMANEPALKSFQEIFRKKLYPARSSLGRMKSPIENIEILRLPNFHIWEPQEACKY